MRIIILSIIILLQISCAPAEKKRILGSWIVWKIIKNDKLVIPDTTFNSAFYPELHFFKSGQFVDPTTYSQRYLLGDYKIAKEHGVLLIKLYNTSNGILDGNYQYELFDSTHTRPSKFLILYNSELYMLAEKTSNLEPE